jgi:hypothetical protein
VPRLLAKGKPFDHGAFRVVQEPLDAAWPASDAHRFSYGQVQWSEAWSRWQMPNEHVARAQPLTASVISMSGAVSERDDVAP